MNDSLEIETSSAVVTVAGITNTDPLAVTLVHIGRDVNGVERHFVQQVPVRGKELRHQFLSEVKQGDRIQATVTNVWREEGCDTYLSEFHKIVNATSEIAGIEEAKGKVTETLVPTGHHLQVKVRR